MKYFWYTLLVIFALAVAAFIGVCVYSMIEGITIVEAFQTIWGLVLPSAGDETLAGIKAVLRC